MNLHKEWSIEFYKNFGGKKEESGMKVAYMKEKMHIEVRDDAQIPEPKEGEVLVKIEACGICGSDVHFYKDGRVET